MPAQSVASFISSLDHPLKKEVEALRSIVLEADERVREEIKWNAPSFHVTDHFATMKLHPATSLQLVLHTGAKKKREPGKLSVADPAALLRWASPDRAVITFRTLADLEERKDALSAILHQWIALTQ